MERVGMTSCLHQGSTIHRMLFFVFAGLPEGPRGKIKRHNSKKTVKLRCCLKTFLETFRSMRSYNGGISKIEK